MKHAIAALATLMLVPAAFAVTPAQRPPGPVTVAVRLVRDVNQAIAAPGQPWRFGPAACTVFVSAPLQYKCTASVHKLGTPVPKVGGPDYIASGGWIVAPVGTVTNWHWSNSPSWNPLYGCTPAQCGNDQFGGGSQNG